MRLSRWIFALLCLSLYADLQPVFAIRLTDILTKSPGPLSKHHSEYDAISGCINCHANRLGGDIENPKCFSCHPDIEERVQAKKGYHKDKTECHECHSEHKGLDGYIFAPENWLKTFNHSETDYELLGAHKKVECRDCHDTYRTHFKTKQQTKTESYLDAKTTCYECHDNVYEHDFNNKEWLVCTQCHSTGIENWKRMAKTMEFNHDKVDYPLEGLHEKVACADCHQPDPTLRRVTTFEPLEFGKCTDCHYDVHENRFGQDCESCHSVYRPWSQVAQSKDPITGAAKDFDHSKTKFPLIGHHQAVKCEGCHYEPKANFKVEPQNFDECSDCHGFAHDIQFSDQKCESCHSMENRYYESTFTLERHNKESWPLTGKHQVLDCNKCHFSGQFEGLSHAECDDCHQNPHDKRQIDQDCSFCHVTTSFSWIQFDHNKQTDFNLTGKHREVACLSCHVDQVFKNMPASNANPNCQGCHADPHGPKMGDECVSCHATEGFKLVRDFNHEKLFDWALEGRHSELSCQKCHSNHLKGDYTVPITQKDLKATDCANCHMDVHAGRHGQNCSSCHTVQSFSVVYGEKVHDLGYFQLEGYHDQMACTECHRPDTQIQGMGIQCVNCHEKNDVHLGKMGPECGDCHRQTSWTPSTFKHNMTAFRLTGAHRYAECSSCHVNQIYQGLPTDCYFCHSDSKLSGVDAHGAANSVIECSDCHSTISWGIQRGAGIP